ncbi:MAG: hypothetical protein ACI39E_02440 [Acutalibacteraceae bacterium]
MYDRTYQLLTAALVLAAVATVPAMIFITPEKRRASLNTFFQIAADIFNFKSLLMGYITKALYIFCTVLSLAGGLLLLFSEPLTGLWAMLVGPILTRIAFEPLKMIGILVTNVMRLNDKIPNKNGEKQASPSAALSQKPTAPPAEE